MAVAVGASATRSPPSPGWLLRRAPLQAKKKKKGDATRSPGHVQSALGAPPWGAGGPCGARLVGEARPLPPRRSSQPEIGTRDGVKRFVLARATLVVLARAMRLLLARAKRCVCARAMRFVRAGAMRCVCARAMRLLCAQAMRCVCAQAMDSVLARAMRVVCARAMMRSVRARARGSRWRGSRGRAPCPRIDPRVALLQIASARLARLRIGTRALRMTAPPVGTRAVKTCASRPRLEGGRVGRVSRTKTLIGTRALKTTHLVPGGSRWER